ncbi:MAG: toprim domain-containing protein, partial [Prolixibacteraceae bacterium]|nr:toprim domain-containing protein [Prolixibacteraceae bacterium]
HKSQVLYGIFQAKREITRVDKCYLVEGYTDVLAFYQAGIENVVASSGTALTSEQIRLIKRFTPNITIIYDGDEAGIKASLRGIDLVLEEGMNVKVLLLPGGEDPDSFSKKKSSTELEEFIKTNETDFIRFKTQLLLKETENDPVAKARLITDVIRSVAVIPDTITRSVYIKECSRLLNVEEEVLYTEVRKIKRKNSDDLRKQVIREKPEKVVKQPVIEEKRDEDILIEEKELLKFLLKYCRFPLFEIEEVPNHPKVVTAGEFIIGEIENDDLVKENSLFAAYLNEVKEKMDDVDTDLFKYFINHPDVKINQLTSDLLSEKHIESKRWHRAGAYAEREEDILDMLIPRIVSEYKLRKVRDLISDLNIKIGQTDDFNKMLEIMAIIQNLKKVEKILSDKLGNRTIN